MQCRLEVAAELQQRWRRTNRRRKSIRRSSSSHREGSITQPGASCGQKSPRRPKTGGGNVPGEVFRGEVSDTRREREGEEEGLGSSGSRSGETSIAGRITTAAAQRQEEGKRSDELSAAETQSPTSTHARTFAASPDTCPHENYSQTLFSG